VGAVDAVPLVAQAGHRRQHDVLIFEAEQR
jgi:hypothetical protein